MRPTDYKRIIYQLKLGKCNWTLRTWCLLRQEAICQYLVSKLDMDQPETTNQFYPTFARRYVTADSILYNGIDGTMYMAAAENNIPLVKKMIQKGSREFDESLWIAAALGHVEMVIFLLKNGATNVEEVRQDIEETLADPFPCEHGRLGQKEEILLLLKNS